MITTEEFTYLSIDEAMERYQISRRTIYRRITDGLLRAYRQSGDIRSYLRLDEADRVFLTTKRRRLTTPMI